MATAQTTKSTEAKVEKIKKPAVPVSKRLVEQLKRGALQGKLTADELDSVSALALSLKAFVTTA